MAEAKAAMAGFRYRPENSSIDSVRSWTVKFVSTCFCVETVRVVVASETSCTESVEPVETVNWFGRRMVRVGPIFPEGDAPSLANCLSYCRLVEPMKFKLAWRIRRASRVMIVGLR